MEEVVKFTNELEMFKCVKYTKKEMPSVLGKEKYYN